MPDPDATTTTADAVTPTARPLPDGWRWARLGDVIADAQPGFASGERDEQGILQLRMNNVDTVGNIIWAREIRVPADEQSISRYLLKPGDVVFNNTNSTDLVGKSALFTGHTEPVTYSNHFTRLRPVATMLDSAYLANWLIMEWQTRTFEHLCNRWVGQSAVKNDKLLALSIPLPPLAEQRRIAAILAARMAAVERARAAAEAQLAAAKALPAAELRAVFECDEAQAWPRARLGDVADVTGGIQKTPQRAPVQFHCPYLTVRNVQQGALDLDAVEQFELTPAELDRYRLQSGDILVVEGNGSPDQIGRNALFMGEIEDCVHQNHLIRVRVDAANCAYQFVSIFLNSPSGRAQLLEKASSTTGLHTLSVAKIQSLEVVLPPMPAQRHIAIILTARMADIAQLRASLEAELDTINALPAALLRQAFNGEL